MNEDYISQERYVELNDIKKGMDEAKVAWLATLEKQDRLLHRMIPLMLALSALSIGIWCVEGTSFSVAIMAVLNGWSLFFIYQMFVIRNQARDAYRVSAALAYEADAILSSQELSEVSDHIEKFNKLVDVRNEVRNRIHNDWRAKAIDWLRKDKPM